MNVVVEPLTVAPHVVGAVADSPGAWRDTKISCLQLFRELIDTLQRLKEQENMLKVAEGSDSAEEVSEAALNGSASDISGALLCCCAAPVQFVVAKVCFERYPWACLV